MMRVLFPVLGAMAVFASGVTPSADWAEPADSWDDPASYSAPI